MEIVEERKGLELCSVEFCTNVAEDVCFSCSKPMCEKHLTEYDYTAELSGDSIPLCPDCYAECHGSKAVL